MEPAVSSTDDNTKAMLVYQANMANSMKQMTELLRGEAREQAESLDKLVQQFTAGMERSLGADFERLGASLKRACSAQEVYADNYRSMAETTQALLQANLSLQKTLEETMGRQEALAKQLKEQAKRIDDTCDAINEEISNQLYTYAETHGM